MNLAFDTSKPEYVPSNNSFGRMGPRLRLEVRTLLPFATAMVLCEVLVLIGCLILDSNTNSRPLGYFAVTLNMLGLLFWPASLCALCLQSFLSEFQDATMAQLIVQPISRRQIWQEKIGITSLLLLGAVGIGYLMFAAFIVITDGKEPHLAPTLSMFAVLVLSFVACVLCMAPGIATLTRKSLASLLLLLGYMLTCCMIIALLGSAIQPNEPEKMLVFWFLSTILLAAAAFTSYKISYQRFLLLEV